MFLVKSTAVLSNNLFAFAVTLVLALAWLRLNDFAAHRGWISASLSRKIIHIGTGPIFVACWLLFQNTASARYLAALIPLAITAQFFLVGIGVIQDQSAVEAMSRHGDRREILHGPLYYGVVFVVITLLYWYETPAGIVALMLMCGGDGLADIVGRRFGKSKLPWNAEKSWLGSLGMFLGGLITSAAILGLYIAAGIFPGPWGAYVIPLMVITLASTLVESLPFKDVDNITVTLVALFLGRWLLG
jgi:phytol kinase